MWTNKIHNVKVTKFAIINIYRKKSFEIICKNRIKLYFRNKYVHYRRELHEKVNYLMKTDVFFSGVSNYLRPSSKFLT